MTRSRRLAGGMLIVGLLAAVVAKSEEAQPPLTMGSVLEASEASDWRAIDPSLTLYLQIAGGRIVMELAPDFAPRHVENIQKLVRERFFDGLAITRSQENYVVQWGDPAAEGEARRPIRTAESALEPEFDLALAGSGLLTRLDDPDAYASDVGFAHGLPVGVDNATQRMWPAHCYGMLGVGRDVSPSSGSGAELYVVIGHSPRHLDRNVTLVGRVVQGMEHLSTLPRGTGGLGFYEDPGEHVAIESIRLGSELPKSERAQLETLRTDTQTFRDLIAARRTRTESWFAHSTGRIGLCNVPLPVRSVSR